MAVPGGWASVIVRSSFPLARSHMVICIRNKITLYIPWPDLIIMNKLFAIKIACEFKGLLRLTCPLAKPHSSRVQSWLILRADTAPYTAPVAVVPRQRRRAWFWSEIKIYQLDKTALSKDYGTIMSFKLYQHIIKKITHTHTHTHTHSGLFL